MERKLHFLESFVAQGSDGNAYKVCAYEHLVRDDSLNDGREHWEPTGQLEYRLQDGAVLEPQAGGVLRIASSGVTLSHPSRAHALP